MVPTIALGRPNYFSRIVCKTKKRLTGINVRIGLLANHHSLLASLRIHDAKLDHLHAATTMVVVEALAVREPFEARAVLKRKFQRGGFNICAFAGLHVENDRLGLRENFSRKRVNVSECLRTKLIRRNKLQTSEASRIPAINTVGIE